MNETQLLRKKFAMIFAEIWTSSPTEIRESAQMEIDRVMEPDSTVNWITGKLGFLPKFPTERKEQMENEMMKMLTTFQVNPEGIPTLAEAREEPEEALTIMVEILMEKMDLLAGERA